MEINENTKISALIKHNEKSIEAIAALSKPLRKLKNPILRKVMAPRVTIAEAAKIGKSSIEEFARALEPLGFVFISSKDTGEEKKQDEPIWLDRLAKKDIDFFDVRALIEKGDDPLKDIVQRFKTVQTGQALCIINSFVPTPLIHRLEKNNVLSYTQKVNEELFHTFFFKSKGEEAKSSQTEGSSRIINNNKAEFDSIFKQFDTSKVKTLDVRHLEMPLPMQTILGALPDLTDREVLYIHHKRIPIYLLEEIADKNYSVHLWKMDEENVKILIYQNTK